MPLLERKNTGTDFDESDHPGSSNENVVLFYVNHGGFPVNGLTWERMWDYVSKNHPSGLQLVREIRTTKLLPEVSVPHAPISFPPDSSVNDRLDMVQRYMQQLQYNHTGTQFFDIRKNRPLCGLMDIAKEMIREALPIKCLEAVILGIYLTSSITGLDRFPVSFRSTFKGTQHKHVVLGVHYNGRYGALGMSRREDLMYKPLAYRQLSEMLIEFHSSYKKYFHVLDRVKIGLSVSHDPHSFESVQWRVLNLNMVKLSETEMCHEVDKFSREIRLQTKRWSSIGCAQAEMKARSKSETRASSPKRAANVTLQRIIHDQKPRTRSRKLSRGARPPTELTATLDTSHLTKVSRRTPNYQIRI